MATYKLVWDDFCSWFLEMMKPNAGEQISSEARKQVNDLFAQILQLVHPFMPFISEEIWQSLGERKAGETIMNVPYHFSPATENEGKMLRQMEEIQDIITAIRAFRAEKGIANKVAIQLLVNTQAENESIFGTFGPILQKFLNTSEIALVKQAPETAAGSVRVRTHEIYIPLDESIDLEAEIAKINTEIEYTQGFLNSVLKKLSNEKFVNNAPAVVLENERKKQADAEMKLQMLREALLALSN